MRGPIVGTMERYGCANNRTFYHAASPAPPLRQATHRQPRACSVRGRANPAIQSPQGFASDFLPCCVHTTRPWRAVRIAYICFLGVRPCGTIPQRRGRHCSKWSLHHTENVILRRMYDLFSSHLLAVFCGDLILRGEI